MRSHLESYQFMVITDHRTFKWLHSIKLPCGRIAGWALELQRYDFDVQFRRRSQNKLQTLSHETQWQRFPTNAGEKGWRKKPKNCLHNHLPHECAWIKKVYNNVLWNPRAHPEYQLDCGFLYRRIQNMHRCAEPDNTEWKQVCVAKPFRNRVLRENHNDVTDGRLGTLKTSSRMSARYYWTEMCRDIKKYIYRCTECLQYKHSQSKPPDKMTDHWRTMGNGMYRNQGIKSR